jgi:hypothetical protein
MNASRSAPITALVVCTPCVYARPAALFARFEESILAKRALIILVQIFAVAETERPAIAVHQVAVPAFGLVGILDDGFARLALRLGGRHLRLTKFQRHRYLFRAGSRPLRLRNHRGLRWVRGFRMAIVQEYREGVRDDAVVHRCSEQPFLRVPRQIRPNF